MACSQSNCLSETRKIVPKFFAKGLHIILGSRSPCVSSRNFSGELCVSSPSSSSSSSPNVWPSEKWFNLAIRDCPAALDNIDICRQRDLKLMEMVVDVILVQRRMFPNCWNSNEEEYLSEAKSGKIIERWVLQYESRRNEDSSSGNNRTGGTSSQSLYKKSLILLRSLYLTVRLLPAYKLFRDLNSSGQILTFSLAHRVCSFAEPFKRWEEAEMRQFDGFVPVDTSCGRLCLSVSYCPNLSNVNSEPSIPIFPLFIPDYVGSPTTDPFKRFPSLTGFTSHGSPSAPIARPHSWSYGLYKAPVTVVSPSPSPTCGLLSNLSTNCHPPFSSPHPTITWSPSPSPPTHFPGSRPSKVLVRTESAPSSLPAAKICRSPGLPNSHVLPPSPFSKGPRLGSFRTDNAKSPIRLGQVQGGISAQKMLSLGKDEDGNPFGAKIRSNSSLQILFSRSSSKRSLQDEFDETNFVCPFAVDDGDMMDLHSRPESFDGKGYLCEGFEPGGLPVKKAQDAAVGTLIGILQAAKPLHHDINSIKLSAVSKPEIWNKSIQEPDGTYSEMGAIQNIASNSGHTSSRPLMLKTAANALEELQSYREMKDLMLRRGSGFQAIANDASATETVGGVTV